MLLSFARIGAVVGMRVRDYRRSAPSSATLALHEKGGKFHRVPAHHTVVELLDAYLAMGELKTMPEGPLWQSSPGHAERLSGRALSARAALKIVKRSRRDAGLPGDIGNHSMRATGITLHQDAGGNLEATRQIAGHASIKTTQLYNRAGDRKRTNEIERVQL